MNAASYIANLKPGVSLVEAANAGTSEGVKKSWEHRMRHFTKSDWDGMAGAERPEGSEPMIGEREHPNGHGWTAVADKNGVQIHHTDKEGNMLGWHHMDMPFEAGKHVAEAALNAPSTEHLKKMGFKWNGAENDEAPEIADSDETAAHKLSKKAHQASAAAFMSNDFSLHRAATDAHRAAADAHKAAGAQPGGPSERLAKAHKLLADHHSDLAEEYDN